MFGLVILNYFQWGTFCLEKFVYLSCNKISFCDQTEAYHQWTKLSNFGRTIYWVSILLGVKVLWGLIFLVKIFQGSNFLGLRIFRDHMSFFRVVILCVCDCMVVQLLTFFSKTASKNVRNADSPYKTLRFSNTQWLHRTVIGSILTLKRTQWKDFHSEIWYLSLLPIGWLSNREIVENFKSQSW